MSPLKTSNTLSKNEQEKQIRLFYRYLKPVHTSLLIYNKEKGVYSKEYTAFTSSEDSFANKTLEYNKKGDSFACRNRFQFRRLANNVTFLKTIVIDIDNDIDNEKSKKFEELMKKHNIYIEAKAESRAQGGFHYYISYRPTTINDENRKEVQKILDNFKYFLIKNNIDIDKKIFDLSRLIRIWGSRNHKRKSYCRLIYLHTANDNQINNNYNFINSLEEEKFLQLPTASSIVTSCSLIEYARSYDFESENPDAYVNDKLLKNVAAFLKTLFGEEGKMIAMEICKRQNHSIGEMEGWWKKAESDIKFNCGELNNFLKESYPSLMPMTCGKCRLLNRNKIEHLNSSETFYQLKKLARERKKLLINKEIFIKGIIAPSFSPYKQEIVIFREYESEGNEVVPNLIVFFDEKKPSSKWREINSLNVDFYIYELVEEGVQYLLLTEKKLDYGEYYIEGSATKLTDRFPIGNVGMITGKKKVILLSGAKNLINKIENAEELFKKVKNLKKEDFEDYIFSYFNEDEKETFIFRQPTNIKNLIIAFLFSTKFEFPLHLCIYGKHDSGKSTIIKSIFQKFNEPYMLVDGSNTRLKGLVPSFAKNIPQLGVILESKRICAIDEFLRIIKTDEESDLLGVLNNFLLHDKYSNRTGKGTVEGKMTSKLFVVTNPLLGNNFEDTINKLPSSTLDRILIWKQYKSHYDWVRAGKNKIEKELNIDKYLFLSIYDFFNSFKAKFDKERIMAITEELKPKVPSFMLELYEARYSTHHSMCLVDGLIKFRCLFIEDDSFSAIDEDYETFRKLWDDLILGWWEKISKEEAERLLTEEQKIMIGLIKAQPNLWDYQLEKICKEKNISFKHNYKRLMELNFIEVQNRRIKIVMEEEIDFKDIKGEDV